MGRRTMCGLFLRGGVWHIDKRIRGFGRLCESTGTGDRQEAERFLTRRLEEFRQAQVYGVRPRRTFRQAATKYLVDGSKRSLARDAQDLRTLDPWIGDLELRHVHMGTLAKFIEARRRAGIKSGTVNRSLAVVRRILNLAARLWRDENGLTWLETPPLLQFVNWQDQRKPYPLSWEEQKVLLQELLDHLARMVLFKINTGCREQEVCRLRRDWEVEVPELKATVFLIPCEHVKNGEERLVVVNAIAKSVVENERGKHGEFVFTYKGKPVTKIYNSARKRVREKVGLPQLRVHDLKHTFGRRLRAAGVSLETRRVLLGHTNGDITSRYSAPELEELFLAASKVCSVDSRKTPAITLLRRKAS